MNQIPEVKMRPLEALIPYARNARSHSEAQVEQIAASIREFGFNNPILIKDDLTVIAGHGRLAAAKKLGLKEVPTICLAHLSPTQVRAYILADNKLALNAGWDEEMLALELAEIKDEDIELELLGFSKEETDKLLGLLDAEEVSMPALSDEERPAFQQKTFVLHNEQIEEVDEAITLAKSLGHGQSAVNENGNGNALAYICQFFNRQKHDNE